MGTWLKKIKQNHVTLALVATIGGGLIKTTYAPHNMESVDLVLLGLVTVLFMALCFVPPPRKEIRE